MRHKRWRSSAVFLAAALIPLLAGAAPAAALDVERKVTLSLRDVPLRSAVEALFHGTGGQYAIQPNVPNVPVHLNLRDASLQSGLRALIRQAAVAVPGLTLAREGDLFVIKIRPLLPNPVPGAGEEAPPEFAAEVSEVTWEKVPIQFNNVAVFVLAFGGQMFPTEADVLLGGDLRSGGLGGGFAAPAFGGLGGGFNGGGFNGGGFGGAGFGGLTGGFGGFAGFGGGAGLGGSFAGGVGGPAGGRLVGPGNSGGGLGSLSGGGPAGARF